MKQILSDLRDLLPLGAREASVVFIGDVTAKLLTFLITLTFLGLVTPSEYKLYGLFITVLATINQFTDSGIHQSFIRFYSLHKHDNPARAQAHFQVALRLKSLLILVAATGLYFGAEFLATGLLKTPELVKPFRIMTIAVIGGAMMEFILSVLQARQEFVRFTLVRISEAAIKTGMIYVSIIVGAFSLTFVYASYAIAPLIVGAAALWFVLSLRSKVSFDWKDIIREMWSFGKWIMITSFATMFLMRLDVFMISPMLEDQPVESGLYMAAVRLCVPLIVLAGSVSTVFFPKAMGLRSLDEMRRYVRRTFTVSIPVTGIGLLYLIVMYFAIPMFFQNYTASLPLFAVLFIGYAWTIIGNPLTMLMLSIGRARIGTYIALVQLPLTFASHYVFITFMGAMGAAVSSVLVWFAAGIISMTYIYLHRHEIVNAVPETPVE